MVPDLRRNDALECSQSNTLSHVLYGVLLTLGEEEEGLWSDDDSSEESKGGQTQSSGSNSSGFPLRRFSVNCDFLITWTESSAVLDVISGYN